MTAATVSIVRLPYDDLERYLRARCDVERLTVTRMARMCDVARETVYRWRRAGHVPEFAADRAAVALGVHPATIWGGVWWSTVEPDEELDETERLLLEERRSSSRIDLALAALRARSEGAPWPQLRLIDCSTSRDAVERVAERLDGAV